MSSSDSELKGGHPPAVKVGGMRITQHKGTPEKVEPPKEKPSEEEPEEWETEESPSPPKQTILISGAVARGDADFPTQAVQATHTKPIPSHEYRAANQRPNVIHQPRK